MTTMAADRAPMPGMKVYNMKLGMWVFLLSEVMFFTGLIGSYIILRFAHPTSFADPGVVLNVPLTAFNTFVLICSSVTMVKAFVAIQHGDQRGLQRWLLATILLVLVLGFGDVSSQSLVAGERASHVGVRRAANRP